MKEMGLHNYLLQRTQMSQRQAIVNIFTGKAKGDGPFAIFSGTFRYILDPQYVEIK